MDSSCSVLVSLPQRFPFLPTPPTGRKHSSKQTKAFSNNHIVWDVAGLSLKHDPYKPLATRSLL